MAQTQLSFYQIFNINMMERIQLISFPLTCENVQFLATSKLLKCFRKAGISVVSCNYSKHFNSVSFELISVMFTLYFSVMFTLYLS